MAYNMMRQGDTDEYNNIVYCCDTRADVEQLPKEIGMGSSCVVLEDSSVWMLSSEKVWKELL